MSLLPTSDGPSPAWRSGGTCQQSRLTVAPDSPTSDTPWRRRSGFIDTLPLRMPNPPEREPDDGHRVVLDLDVRVIDVRPVAEDLFGRAHAPQQEVDVVRRLVHQHAAALGVPAAAPGVPAVVGLGTPHLAVRLAEDDAARRAGRVSSASRIRCAAGNQRRCAIVDTIVPCLLAASRIRSASSRRRRQRLLDDAVDATLGGQHQRVGVQRVGRTHAHHVKPRARRASPAPNRTSAERPTARRTPLRAPPRYHSKPPAPRRPPAPPGQPRGYWRFRRCR